MQIEVSATDIEEKKADGRGRVTLGSEYAGKNVTVAVVEAEDDNKTTECIHCGAVDEPEHDVHVRVEQTERGEHYTVCNICEPPEN